MKQLLPYVRRVAGTLPADDAGLLASFAARRDAEAFATLVRRHGPLVRGVCRRWLRDAADVDDAFQATFLVLIRRADAIAHPGQLAGWLHGVARRTARSLRNRSLRHRRRFAEKVVLAELPARPVGDADLGPLLDTEIERLPEKYRLPIVLCHLQGLSRREAARLLGCPEGTLSVRLARALDLLRRRLLRRGLAPAAVATLLVPAASEAVPLAILQATVSAAVRSAAPERIVALTEGVLRMFLIQRLSRAAACLLAVVTLVASGTLLLSHVADAPRAQAEPPSKPAAAPPALILNVTRAGGEDVDVLEGNERVTVHSHAALARYLKRVRSDKTAPDRLTVRAEKDIPFATIVKVSDACRSAGFRDIHAEVANAPPVDRADSRWIIDLRWTQNREEIALEPRQPDLRFPMRYEIVPTEEVPLTFERIHLHFTEWLKVPGVNVEQVQAQWVSDLTKFIEKSPNDAEVPEAMLQIGLTCEFMAKPAEAKAWYERLVKTAPAAREAVKARGSLKRLNSTGQPFELDSTTLTGGKRFRIGDTKGKVIAVYYWASWNHGARADFAKLQSLRTKFPGQFEVVGVSLDDQLYLANELVQYSPLKDAVHVREAGGLESRLATDYGINALPTIFLLDRDGKVVRHDAQVGQLEEEVKKLVK
jgi:RNA polymerase sigma factor (sigma-70 family)